ncbi:MAG: 4Fe-4S dicluster domain-containing protein, partial [Chloroflexota bacterium]|nr:4Fe-4S dicluster domain-containing protein [Chloroflexota bacterium]
MNEGKRADKGRISRRRFLGLSGAGLAGVVALGMPPLVRGLGVGEAPAVPSTTGPRRQWAMVIDLRKCEGCTTIDTAPGCVQHCIVGHYVPASQEWIQVFKVESQGRGSFFMPVPCQHCENAPCVNVCPVAATYHTATGAVLIDNRRCIGCRLCIAACPYQRRFFNWGEPKSPPEARFLNYSPELGAPSVKGTTNKCVWCEHLTKDGKLPHCVSGCPMKALYWADLEEDIATNGAETVQFSTFVAANNAYRFKEGLGTQPRTWYIPGHGEAFGRHPNDKAELKPVS